MAYRIEKTGDIVIDGFEQGISDSPYQGISDMRNANIISIPNEASVNFSTQKISSPTITTGTVTSASSSTEIISYTGATGGLEDGMAIVFSGGSLPGNIVAGTVYWVGHTTFVSGEMQIFATPDVSLSPVNISSSGTGTFTTFVMSTPKHYAYDNVLNFYWLIDSVGRVWSNTFTTTVNNYWVYMGNTVNSTCNGNGIAYFEDAKVSGGSNPGYIFIFRNSGIDYISTSTPSNWQYGWNPLTGAVAASITGTGTGYLNNFSGANNPHNALVGPGNTVYYVDASYVGSWFQTDSTVAFNPTDVTTYTFEKIAIETELNDTNNCLAILGQNLLIGGKRNIIYVWDRVSTLYQYRIYLAERNVVWLETINTSTYIFVGNRGRIYVTNGGQASLYKKVPDHLAGTTVEPYFTWGGVGSFKNQLYFGVSATTNAGIAINNYGGLWAIDVDTRALRLTQQLSYGNYSGIASMVIPNVSTTTPAGAGLYIGWVGGLDATISTPYSNYQTYIDSDIIPIGTYLLKKTFYKIEFKLTTPMLTGDGVRISYRSNITESFTQLGETLYSSGNSEQSNLSFYYDTPFQLLQWIQLRVETKTGSSGSFTRLRELRIS